MTRIRVSIFATVCTTLVAATLFTARPVLAGPPLVCFPFDIGGARTLPMGTGGWHSVDPKYNVSRLVEDTVDLLGANTPVIVRMETLRRATIYAGTNPKVAAALLARIEDRAKAAQPDAGLSVFDLGYLVETYRQASFIFKHALPSVDAVDGYGLVRKALAFKHDPEIEFASAIIASSPRRAEFEAHRRDAQIGAKTDSLLAANLISRVLNW